MNKKTTNCGWVRANHIVITHCVLHTCGVCNIDGKKGSLTCGSLLHWIFEIVMDDDLSVRRHFDTVNEPVQDVP